MDFVFEMFRCGEVIAVAEPFPQTNGERRLCIYPFTTIANQHWVRCDFDMSWYFGQVYDPSVTDILQSCKVLLFNWSISTSPIEGWARTCTHEFFSWKGVFGRWKVLNFGKMVTFFVKTKRKPQKNIRYKNTGVGSLSSGMSYTQDVRKSLPDSFGGPTYRSGYIDENKWMDIRDPHSWKGNLTFEDPSF